MEFREWEKAKSEKVEEKEEEEGGEEKWRTRSNEMCVCVYLRERECEKRDENEKSKKSSSSVLNSGKIYNPLHLIYRYTSQNRFCCGMSVSRVDSWLLFSSAPLCAMHISVGITHGLVIMFDLMVNNCTHAKWEARRVKRLSSFQAKKNSSNAPPMITYCAKIQIFAFIEMSRMSLLSIAKCARYTFRDNAEITEFESNIFDPIAKLLFTFPGAGQMKGGFANPIVTENIFNRLSACIRIETGRIMDKLLCTHFKVIAKCTN